jgi:hypothetical protein
MNVTLFVIFLSIPVLLMVLTYHYGHAEELKVLESQLNKDSITGVLQNPYNYTVGYMLPRAEFYDKVDGHLVGLRDFGFVSKDELKPGEKSTYKIWEHAGETEEFPKTDFIIKVDAQKVDDTDYNDGKVLSFDEQIKQINNYTKSLEDATIKVAQQNGTKGIANYTVTYENGTKELVNKTGTYVIASDNQSR